MIPTIQTQAEYMLVLDKIDDLMDLDPLPGTTEHTEAMELIAQVQAYEGPSFPEPMEFV